MRLKIEILVLIIPCVISLNPGFLVKPDDNSQYTIVFPATFTSQRIELKAPIPYNKQLIKDIWVYANGYISMGNPVPDEFYQDYPTSSQFLDPTGLLSQKIISVFSASMKSGYIAVYNASSTYGLSCQEGLQKNRLEGNIRMLFPGASTFTTKGIIVVNWRNMQNGMQKLKNNFELVILYNDQMSFAVFHFSNITWLFSGSQLSRYSRTELTAGDGLQISATSRNSLDDWNQATNDGVPGEWLIQMSNPLSQKAFVSPEFTNSHLTVIQQRSQVFLSQMPRLCRQMPAIRPKMVDRNAMTAQSSSQSEPTCRDISCTQPGSECRKLLRDSCCVCGDGYHGNGTMCINFADSKTIVMKGSLVLLHNGRILVSQKIMHSAAQSQRKVTGYTSFTEKTIPENLSYTMLLLVPFFDICNGFFANPISTGIRTPKSLFALTGGFYSLQLNFSIESIGEFQLRQKGFGFSGPNFDKGIWETSINIVNLENYADGLYETEFNQHKDPIHFNYEIVDQGDRIIFPEKSSVIKSKVGSQQKSIRWSGVMEFSGNCLIKTLIGQRYFVKLSSKKYCSPQCENKLCKPFCLALPSVTDSKPDYCIGVQCSANQICKSNDENYECVCKEGFMKDHSSQCRKVEKVECNGKICPLGAKCLPVQPGKTECQCLIGFSLESGKCVKDQKICNSRKCQPNSECLKVGGVDTCVCKSGYILQASNDTCIKENQSLCSRKCGENEQCSRLVNDPSFKCNCRSGFKRVKNECQIDECGLCPRNSICISQRCRCMENFYEQSGACIWNCALCNLNNTICTQDGCQCRSGYVSGSILNTCIKIPKCQSSIDCQQKEVCDQGRCVCLSRNNVTGRCESLYGPDGPCSICGANSDCIPLGGLSVKCYCRPGYEPADEPNSCKLSKCSCKDRPNPGHWHCINGACTCKPGLMLLGGHCTECSSSESEADTAACNKNALCVYNQKSNYYHCKCLTGYRGDGLKCLPDAECGVCPRNSECISGNCRCRPGFLPVDGICQWNCTQCDTWTSICGYDSCECRPGFRAMAGGSTCTPEVTCNRNIDCPTNEVCVNSKCHCSISRTDGKCLMDNSGCSACGENTMCDPFTQQCRCRNGFTRQPGTSLFSCVKDCSQCSQRAYCSERGCTCFPPYLGDGVYCELDNECESAFHCGKNSFCGWYEEKRRCLCRRGFKYNRVSRSCELISLSISITPNGLLRVYEGQSFQLECQVSTSDDSPVTHAPQWRKLGVNRLDFARVLAPTIRRRILRIAKAEVNMTGIYECFAGEFKASKRVVVQSSKCKKNCGSNGFCDESAGKCVCREGFATLVPGICVKKTCHYMPEMCTANEICLDGLCQCKFGYHRRNNQCVPKATCLTLKNCHRFADCKLIRGEYSCQCRPGFIGDGFRCQTAPLDCRLNQRCVKNAICSLDSDGAHMCTCRPGYYGEGQKSCNKIINCNENLRPCGPHSGCQPVALFDNTDSSQLYNTGRCVCDTGYELMDDSRCVDISLTKSLFLFAIGNAIIQQSLVKVPDDQIPKIFVADTNALIPGIYAVATDCQQKMIYWSTGRGRRLMMRNAQSPNSSIKAFPYRDIRMVESMAVDWVSGNLFYIDQGWAHIAVINPGTFSRIILIRNAPGARRIALDPLKSRIYWSVTSLEKPSIWTAKMDGSGKQELLQLKFPPHGLAFDYDLRRLCWISPSLIKGGPMLGRAFSLWGHRLSCWSAENGSLVENVISMPDQSLEGGLVYSSGRFYMGKRGKKAIVSIFNGLIEDIPIQHACCGKSLNGFAILSSTCPSGYTNACSRSSSYGRCNTICLPTGPRDSAKCCRRDSSYC